MKWAYRLGLVLVFAAAFFAGSTIGHHSNDEELDAIEAECEESGGVLARTRSGYACAVPLYQAI